MLRRGVTDQLIKDRKDKKHDHKLKQQEARRAFIQKSSAQISKAVADAKNAKVVEKAETMRRLSAVALAKKGKAPPVPTTIAAVMKRLSIVAEAKNGTAPPVPSPKAVVIEMVDYDTLRDQAKAVQPTLSVQKPEDKSAEQAPNGSTTPKSISPSG